MHKRGKTREFKMPHFFAFCQTLCVLCCFAFFFLFIVQHCGHDHSLTKFYFSAIWFWTNKNCCAFFFRILLISSKYQAPFSSWNTRPECIGLNWWKGHYESEYYPSWAITFSKFSYATGLIQSLLMDKNGFATLFSIRHVKW